MGLVPLTASPAEAAPCDAPVVNQVACENTKPGSPPSEWDVNGAGSTTIQGFTTEMSVNVGETVRFKVDTPATSYRLDIYRMGYYGGNGARKVISVTPSAALPQNQPDCLSDTTTGLIDCGNWGVSASWPVPSDAVSGIYFAKLVRTDGTAGSSHVFFVVRNDASHSAMLFQTSDTTWQAYNQYGGNSLYVGSPANRAFKVSYNRPFTTRGTGAEDFVFNAEYPMVRFLEANGYDTTYMSGVDTDRRGPLLRNHKVFMSVGHDEYWSGQQRANVEAARDAGVHLAFFSGNEVFWKTRWENSIDGSGTAYRTLVTYKETHANAKIDPADPPTWTGSWRDPRFSPPADGGRPENGLTGTIFKVNTGTVDLQVPAADGKMRLWRNTSVANQAAGAVAELGSGTVGYEWDEDADNGARPAGLISMSSTTASGVEVLQDYGTNYGTGTATHKITLYRAPSGALVFGAGTVQWSWGLDSNHDRGSGAPSQPMQQATVNLFADMGVQPATLQTGLTAATASTDTTGATATITAPAAGGSVQAGAPTTISGTAADAGGGVVGGIEVSTDGSTWHPANGRASWTYTWTPGAVGSATIRVRATDDSARTGAVTSVTVSVVARSCPCSLWSGTVAPPGGPDGDTAGTEVGTRFHSDSAGTISAIRFYKQTGNSGTHVGHLWTASGTLLATVNFTSESATGWQEATLSPPVSIAANTDYVASYYAPSGRYSSTIGFFQQDLDAPPLHASADSATEPNGVYGYFGAGGGFPDQAWEQANYWVDVVFSPGGGGGGGDTTPPTVTARTPASNATGVSTGTTVTATFSEAIQTGTASVTLTGATAVPGSTAYDPATRTVTFTPGAALTAGTSYTATVSGARDAANNQMAPTSWSFTTAGSPPAGGCPCTIWPATTTPSGTPDADNGAVELGVRFRSDQAGLITGIRFYKGAGNGGTHTGSLWTSTGTRLATATFTSESATGWQQVLFPTPVSINANTTYVASYYAPVGRYYATNSAFATAGVDRAPLHALRNGLDGSNGLYRYGTGGGFPTSTFQSTNYWVDVVFQTSGPDTSPPTVVTTTPSSGAAGVANSTPVSATFSEPVQSGTVQVQLTGPGGAAVAGTTSYDATTQTATLTPSAALTAATTYTARVSGAADQAGNVMNPVTWTFTTGAGATGCPCTIWADTATPAVPSTTDNSAVEVGVRFRTSTAGFITGIRFYKGSGNTGTHVGNLWTSTGTKLSTATFSGESASGWQTATLPAPIAVNANTTYVASYTAPVGFYATTNNGFATAGVTRGPLTALRDGQDGPNGVYKYGLGFPTDTFQSTNYWVDVVFDTTVTDTTPPTVTSRAPATGATGVPPTSTASATFSEPVQAGTVQMTLTGPSGAVAGTVAYDSGTRTATFSPGTTLAASTSYTVNVSGAKDPANNTMSPVSWSFTTAAPATSPLDQGPGGPVLVIRSGAAGASPFTPYLAEILRTEGVQEFATADLSSVTATTLASYDVVLLGQTPLTSAQVSMFTTWVNGGGNLVAFKPDPQLASLLKLTAGGAGVQEGYLKVDTTQAPGAGITDQTIQYHGTADRYTLAGARSVATLYSSATNATTNPAVSLASVGTSGGQAAAFTYDLPQSIVYTRQGNPAWEGQERDGQEPKRSDDMFFGGGAQPDWVNLDKVAIPQADEQQRLLVNLIGSMNLDRKPLPRFWYFPRSAKAVLVATGDDHAVGGTSGRFDKYQANSPAGCNVNTWQCARFTSFIYPDTPLTDAQASTYVGRGFEVALHTQNGCTDYTPTSLAADYTDQLGEFGDEFPSVPAPVSGRFHCLVESDWLSQPTVEAQHGIRFDANYYYWPGSWIADRPGFMTGSGMPMRFASKTGSMVDVYQGATQMTDESEQTYPFTPDTLFDNALGPLGYYGAFVVNMHTDQPTTFQDDQLLASAQSRSIPVVAAKQMLSWLDGRNASSYQNIGWSSNTLTFTANPGSGATGLTGMVPTVAAGGLTLSTLTRGGNAVPFSRTTIKGVEYAMFDAAAGTYQAAYGAAGGASIAAATVADVTDSSAALQVSSTDASRAEVSFGTSPAALTGTVVDAAQAGSRTVTLPNLRPGTKYYYRVRVTGPGRSGSDTTTGTLTTAPKDTAAPVVSGVGVRTLPDGTARASWRTQEDSDSTLLYGRSAKALTPLFDGTATRSHAVVATGLVPNATYYYRVRSVDSAGNVRLWPAADQPPARFVAAGVGVADQTSAQFRTGTQAGTVVSVDDAVRLADGRSGRFESRVIDAQQMVRWRKLTYRADLPAGTSIRISVRTGSTLRPDSTWSAWRPVGATGAVTGVGRYAQYRVDLVSTVAGRTPVLRAVGITNSGSPRAHEKEG